MLALLITFGGFLFAFYRWGKKRRDLEFSELENLKNRTTERVKAATTQGRRMDLFVYYQSLLSSRRFAHLVREIHVCVLHIITFLFLVVYLQRQEDHLYIADRFFPPEIVNTIAENYHISQALSLIFLFVMNVLVRIKLAKELRRLNSYSSGFISELDDTIESAYK